MLTLSQQRRMPELQANAIRSLTSLEALKLTYGSDNAPFTTMMVNALSRASDSPPLKLKKLYISFDYQDRPGPLAQAVRELIASTRSLEKFDLFSVFGQSDNVFDTIASGIEDHQGIHTVEIRVESRGQKARIAQVLQNNRNISNLRVVLFDNSLLDACEIFETIVLTNHPLEHLELIGTDFFTEHFTEAHLKLGELFPQLENLRTLKMAGEDEEDLGRVDDFELPAPIPREFVDGIKNNKSLQSLQISWLRDLAEDAERAIDLMSARNKHDTSLTTVSRAEMLSSFANDVLVATNKYPDTGLSIVLDTLRERDDW